MSEVYNTRESPSKLCIKCRQRPAVEIQIATTTKKGLTRLGSWQRGDLCESCFRELLDQMDNPVLSQELAMEGMGHAYNSAKGLWTITAEEMGVRVAGDLLLFTPDEVWVLYRSLHPTLCGMKNPCALGGVMRSLASGPGAILINTHRHRKSKRASAHRAPKTVWHSLIAGRALDPEELEEFLGVDTDITGDTPEGDGE